MRTRHHHPEQKQCDSATKQHSTNTNEHPPLYYIIIAHVQNRKHNRNTRTRVALAHRCERAELARPLLRLNYRRSRFGVVIVALMQKYRTPYT